MSPLGYYKRKRRSVIKHWHTYLLGCCVALLCSCTEHDVLVDGVSETETETQMLPICFTNSYIDNAVTRQTNSLCDHQPSMGVWGWRNDGTIEEEIFTNQRVHYHADSTAWCYSPLRYWDKESRYTFMAYAPHHSHTSAEVSIAPTTKHLTIRGVTLHGHNLQAEPTETMKRLFAHTDDTDWMIARAGQTATGKSVMEVEFSMQHILAKLNINIKADSTLLGSATSLTADSIAVGALASRGDFEQQFMHTPISNTTAEWTAYDTTLYVKGTNACTIKDTPIYLVETLVIPQQIDSDATITFYYTYSQSDGHTEECRYRLPMHKVIERFASGYEYTLTLILTTEGVVAEKGIRRYEE